MSAFVQSAAAATYKKGSGSSGSVSLKATFTTPTTPGNYVLVVATLAGGVGMDPDLSASGFTQLSDHDTGDLQTVVWGKANCPALSSITIYVDAYRGVTLRLIEYSGVAQASPTDKNVYKTGNSSSMTTGASGTTAQADEVVIGVLANQYQSTTQSGFSGGLTKLFEDVTPDGGTQDWERARTTIHQLITTSTGSFTLGGTLATSRRWIGTLITLKGSSSGPAKLYSSTQPALYTAGGNGGSQLTVFGRFISQLQPALYYPGVSVRSRIGPGEYQYVLGGWGGLTIGQGTDYLLEEVDGLEGFEVRTSDQDLPRDDGALRGVDLLNARLITFKTNFTGTRTQIETRWQTLLRQLVAQRDTDWELLWRHPGQPLKSTYVRPTSVLRGLDPVQVFLASQAFVLRAADPRHYAATISTLQVPITSDRNSPNLAQAQNMGNADAYPTIYVDGPSTGAATRATLTNTSTGGVFDVLAVLGPGSELVGDMRARVAGLPVSAVTIDDVSKYGAWQSPRIPLRLQPGINNLMFEVEPAGTAVTCAIEYRSTWSG